jgi:hypothetical protein
MTTITLDDILQTMNEPVSDLPLKTIIDAYFDGTKHMHDFGREVLSRLARWWSASGTAKLSEAPARQRHRRL